MLKFFKNKTIRNHLRSIVLIGLLGIPTAFIFCRTCWSDMDHLLKVIGLSAVIWIVLWKGNEAVANLIDTRMDWSREPIKRLLAGIFGHIFYTALAMFVLNYVVLLLLGWNREVLTWSGFLEISIPAIIITILIASILTAREFFLAWRQSAVQEERMKMELMSARYESLKNQVNPHFLFNSLNVLTSLVYKDVDLSARFIKKLSNVYRYVLDVRDKQVVDLDEDLEFLRSFNFLLKMRHMESLQININVPENTDHKVVPLALQMLVENAVKHNRIDKHEPLTISVFLDDGYLVVKNNLQKKQQVKNTSPQVGLSNIKARYEYLSDKPVIIEENDDKFEVKLPLLMVQS